MPGSLAEVTKQVSAVFKTMSAGKLITLFLLVVSTVAGLIVLMSWSSAPELMPLYTHLSPEDASEVVTVLREQKIEYKLTHNGGTIQIPSGRLYDVRLDLASKGLPRGSGVGFEVFDNAKLGMTEFVQNINYQRALQGELSRTINGLAEVESSRVHIVMSARSLFIEDEEPASASVILKLGHGRWLNDDQIQGIIYLVSSSVPRLSPEKVTVVDHNGKLLAGLEEPSSTAKISSNQLEFQQRKEKLLEKRVLTMLEKVLGKDKATVRVACDLDFVQQEKTEEMYIPENQVVRSEQLMNERSSQPDAAPAGIPGLASNITQERTAENQTLQPNSFQKQDQTRNYEIGKTTNREIKPVGKLQRLSVAVVVDGTYKTVTRGKGDQQRKETKYIARSAEEMATLERIVQRAVNFDESRGDKVAVANIAFHSDELIAQPEPGGVGQWLNQLKRLGSFFKYAAAGLFVLMCFVYVIRPLIRWLTDTPWEDVELLEHLPKSLAEIEDQYSQGEQKSEFVDQAAKTIAAYEDDSTQLMQQWLKQS